MPEAVRSSMIAISFAFLATAGYYRIQSQRSGEPLDRYKESWPLMIGIRLAGLLTFGSGAAWLWNPARFQWASLTVAVEVRWIGVAGFACSLVWLVWMFHTLGRNLTTF